MTRPALRQIVYPGGIRAIDAGYQRPMLAAIHLVVQDGEAALIDTGVNQSVPSVLAVLDELGLAPEAVKWVMLTHVHLDHAGGAGLLMQELPQARLTVHPRGAPHMRDPSRLVAATEAVYGTQATRELYGDILPVDPARIVETPDGTRLSLGRRSFEFLDTPGHARHHVCIVDQDHEAIFTGDTFGLSYRELSVGPRQWVFPATTPSQFDPDELLRSIALIADRKPRAVYLTHFGEVLDVQDKARDLQRLVAEHGDLAERARGIDQPLPLLIEGIRDMVLAEAQRQRCPLTRERLLELFGDDIRLNADGVMAYLARGPSAGGRAPTVSASA